MTRTLARLAISCLILVFLVGATAHGNAQKPAAQSSKPQSSFDDSSDGFSSETQQKPATKGLSLKDIADAATALSLVVGVITFALAAFEHRQREREKLDIERQKQIQNWQRVVVFGIIEGGAPMFDDIKSRYLQEAQQLSDLDLPKKEIQDNALQLALMSLISDRLISKTDRGGYAVNVVSLEENDWKQLAMDDMMRRQNANIIISKLRETLESHSGQYTIERLYKVLEAEKLNFPYEHFDVMVRQYIAANQQHIVIAQNDRVWLRSKLASPAQAKPSGTS